MMMCVPADLLQALHDYLVQRPMREVEGLVTAIRTCKPAGPQETAEDGIQQQSQ
jgi:hypothetical protein